MTDLDTAARDYARCVVAQREAVDRGEDLFSVFEDTLRATDALTDAALRANGVEP